MSAVRNSLGCVIQQEPKNGYHALGFYNLLCRLVRCVLSSWTLYNAVRWFNQAQLPITLTLTLTMILAYS